MRFSVIISAYNIENYIGKCLQSVLNQSFSDYEMIVVDDASTDKTLEKVSLLMENSNKIKLVKNKHNFGVAISRNEGIKQAEGDYIILVDGDDYLKEDALYIVNEAILKFNFPDWIYGNGNYEFRDGMEENIELINDEPRLNGLSGCTGSDALREFVKYRGALWSLWGKAYKRSFWESLNCVSEKRNAEDIEMGYRILERAKSVAIVSPFYCYRRAREGSLINTHSVERVELLGEVLIDWIKYLNDNSDMNDSLKICIMKRLNEEMCCAFLPLIYKADGGKRKNLFDMTLQMKQLFIYPYNCRNRVIFIMKNVLGIKITCKILYNMKKLKNKNI